MKCLTLIRGLPGSGKSSLAELMLGATVSADDYFVVEGGYNFDPARLGLAHAACQVSTRLELAAGRPVVVANTFSQKWEIEPYLVIAKTFGARLYVADLYDGGLTDLELFERNVHGVPLEVITTMRERWEHDWKAGNPLPPWER